MASPSGQKALSVGRVVVVNNSFYCNVLGVILHTGNTSSSYMTTEGRRGDQEKVYTILVICEEDTSYEQHSRTNRIYQYTDSLFRPEGKCGHRIIKVNGLDIKYITTKQLKTDGAAILDDQRKREMPRFRYVLLLLRLYNQHPNYHHHCHHHHNITPPP